MKRKNLKGLILTAIFLTTILLATIRVSAESVYLPHLDRSYSAATDACFNLRLDALLVNLLNPSVTTPPYTCTAGVTALGDATTQFDIMQVGPPYACYYYYDGTGTAPDIRTSMTTSDSMVIINGQNFNAANNGYFLVITAVTDGFYAANGDCIPEANKTIGTGSVGYRINEIAIGSATTQFDITNPTGTTCRYTWDLTGADPGINVNTFKASDRISIASSNFSAANNGEYNITGAGTSYFEITNAACVVESDKTIGAGYIKHRVEPFP